MKTVLTVLSAALLVTSMSFSADAAPKKKDAEMAKKEATCKAEAKKKFTAVHFMKRRDYVKKCMA
ncbi:MAG: hypothetical protein JO254_05315 [Pseudolabrys sp.]|nr:hypothetical protein [Pseudolabrys sp.]